MRITRYLGKELYFFGAIVLLTFLSLQFFFSFLAEFSSIGKGHYDVFAGLIHALMTLPKRFYQLLPEVFLMSCILGLGSLSETSELMAFRSFGCSPIHLWHKILWVFLPVILLILLFTETLLPQWEYQAERYKAVRLSNEPIAEVGSGIWIREANTFTHFKELDRLGHIQGLFRFSFDDERHLSETLQAPSAFLKKGHFEIENPKCLHFSNTQITEHCDQTDTWPTQIPKSILSLLTTSPEWLTLHELLKYVRYLKDNQQSSENYEFFIYRKLLYPLLLCVLPLIALFSVLGPLRQANTGSRLLFGVLSGFSLHVVIELLGSLSLLKHLNPFWLWGTLLSALTWFLLKRLRGLMG